MKIEHKYKVSFDNHAACDFTFDEIILGHLFLFCQLNDLQIKEYKRFAGTARDGSLIYEGDRVIAATGRKTKPNYESTVVLYDGKPCKLSPNLGILVDAMSTITIQSKL